MAADGDAWLTALAGQSDMGQAVRDFDWSTNPLGPPAQWPEGLRSAVMICLATRFPVLVVWGPELIKIYNDGYRVMLGRDKHPRALGAPAAEVWPELWDIIGPLFETVMASGVSTWSENECLIVDRNGFAEESYFTFSYSPLYDGDRVAGVLDLSVETTDLVLSERRLRCITALSAALANTWQVTDVCVDAVHALGPFVSDIQSAEIYLRAGENIVLVASNRRGGPSGRSRIDLPAVVDGQIAVVGDHDGGRLPAALVGLPIGAAFGGVQGAAVFSLSEQRPFDEEYQRFVQALVDTIDSAIEGAYRRSMEVGEYRQISDTLQAAMLPSARDRPTVAARYLPATGKLAVGGDWYDVIDLDDHRRALVVGDCVGHGLNAATVMGQLRSAARAMLLADRSPAEVLSGLDIFAAQVDGAASTTMMCAVFDRQTHRLTYARAGHPPPLLVGERGSRWLDDDGGPPLAVNGDIRREQFSVDVDEEDLIVMYSDGLIERRGEVLDVGMARLSHAAFNARHLRVEEIADQLLQELRPENARDDVVLVVKRFRERISAPVGAAQ